jgi:integrase
MNMARVLVTKRNEELEQLRESGGHRDVREDPLLVDFARRHLGLKAGSRAASTVERDSRALEQLIGWFGQDAHLGDLTVARLSEYAQHRRQMPGKKAGTTIAPQTILHELHALSSLMKRAVSEGHVLINPVVNMSDKPQLRRTEAVWLVIGESARLMRTARELAARSGRTASVLGELVATCLLTGGRKTEVFGLEVRDVDLENGVVHIRPNSWRGIKTLEGRWVPLWPQLGSILTDYLERSGRNDGLLFPAPSGGLFTDLRGSLEAAVEEAEITKRVTWHTFRHTYIATRLQTLDNGAPVAPYTVAREVGHQSLKLIEKTYGHLLRTRHRQTTVEYREAKVLNLEERTA